MYRIMFAVIAAILALIPSAVQAEKWQIVGVSPYYVENDSSGYHIFVAVTAHQKDSLEVVAVTLHQMDMKYLDLGDIAIPGKILETPLGTNNAETFGKYLESLSRDIECREIRQQVYKSLAKGKVPDLGSYRVWEIVRAFNFDRAGLRPAAFDELREAVRIESGGHVDVVQENPKKFKTIVKDTRAEYLLLLVLDGKGKVISEKRFIITPAIPPVQFDE